MILVWCHRQMIYNVGDFISHYGILNSELMVFVDDNVVRSRQMRVFLLCSQVPIFVSAINHCLGRSQPSNVSFLRTIEYFGLFISESFVVCCG
jgi:hypothetical protein